MKRLFAVSALSAALALAPGRSAWADEGGIHQCKDANGQLVYQDEPCLEVVPAQANPVAKTPAKTPAKSPAKTPAKSSAKPPADTPVKPPLVARPPTAAKPVAPQPQLDPKNWVITAPPAPRRVAPAATGRSLDGRLATPEKTLQTFVNAVKAGDRPLVVSCLTSSALADLGPDPPELPMDKLLETVDSFTGYVAEGELGPFWSIRVQRGGLRPKWIFFERTGSGDWKIAAI